MCFVWAAFPLAQASLLLKVSCANVETSAVYFSQNPLSIFTPSLDTRVYWRWGTCPRCRSDLENRVARSGSRGALGPPRTQSGPKNVGAGTADVVRGRSELTAGSQPVSSDGANSVFQGPLRHLGQVPASRGLGHAKRGSDSVTTTHASVKRVE